MLDSDLDTQQFDEKKVRIDNSTASSSSGVVCFSPSITKSIPPSLLFQISAARLKIDSQYLAQGRKKHTEMMVTPGKKLRATSPCSYIPDEILFFNILNRLPVKPLVRFKSVSTHWNAMIEDPEFIQSHSIRAKQKSSSGSSIVGLFQVKRKDTKQLGREYFFVPKESLRHFHIQTSNRTYIVGICNGLLCIRSRYGLEICNPCTGEFLYHPLPRPPPPHCFTCYGFCYDPLKNQYKVIQIVHGNRNGNFYRCMVYTFGSDNDSWKDITAKSNLSRCLTNHFLNGSGGLVGVVNPDRAVHSKGALHWFFRDVQMIMSFDIHYEKFGLIKGPVSAKMLRHVSLFITEWEGCMCLAFQNHPQNGVRIFIYKSDAREHLIPYDYDQNIWSDLVVPIRDQPTRSKTGFLGGDSRLLYWFTEGYISFYSPVKAVQYNKYNSEYETRERYPLPRGVDHSLVTEYEFMHQIDNPLSLKTLLPSVPNQVGHILSPVHVRSVSSL